jgi:hypothetical protein
VGLNRGRAEAYLRLVAEGELCRAATFPQAGGAAAALYGLPRRQREAIALQHYARLPEPETARATRLSVGAVKAHTVHGMAALQTALAADTGRLAGVAQVLTAVRALDDGVADQILQDFALARAIRRAGPSAQRSPDPGSLLRSSAVRIPLAMLMSCPSAAAAAARSAGPVTAPYSAVPVGQMIPVRGEGEGISGERQDVTGQIYVLSYTRTARDAWLTVAARTRGEFVPPGIEPSSRYRPYTTFPVHQFAATDDRGTRYQMSFRGRGERRHDELTGQITLQPGPPPGIRWLDLATIPGEPAVRVDLNRSPDDTEMTLRPAAASLGEHLLNTIAMRLLLLVLEFPQEIRFHPVVPLPEPFACIADGLGDAVAALQACGALSPLSPVPGHLAALCAALNVTGHGITAPPARDLPGPWLSMLAHYRRRKRPTASDGCAAVAAAFPELDGIRLTIAGLHNSADRSVLFVQAAGVTADGYDGRLGVDLEFPLRIWVRDSSGRWHATRACGWTGAGRSEVTMRLQVLPSLSRDTAWIDVLAAGHSAEVHVTLPLRWQ